MMKDMLHKKKIIKQNSKGEHKHKKKIVVNFFISFFVVVVCLLFAVVECASTFKYCISPTFGGAKQMAAAREETDYDFIHKIFKNAPPPNSLHTIYIVYGRVPTVYFFQCLYTLATFDVGWAAAVANRSLTLPQSPSYVLCMLDSTSS